MYFLYNNQKNPIFQLSEQFFHIKLDSKGDITPSWLTPLPILVRPLKTISFYTESSIHIKPRFKTGIERSNISYWRVIQIML